MHTSPLDDLERLLDRLDTGIDMSMPRAASCDIAERDDEYTVLVDLPGYDAEALEVTFSDGRLHIRGEREDRLDVEEDAYVRRERRRAAVNRTIRIPDTVDETAIAAEYADGVLTVTLPKAEETTGGREIEIE